jgi:beta-glucosidase
VVYDLLHGQWKLDADGHPAHFPFGAGGGYTTFTIGGPKISEDGERLWVDVANTGDRVGSTVVFAFGGLPGSDVVRPVRRLIGFARVGAGPGESVRIGLDLDWSQLDVRRDGSWWMESGDYVVTVGFDASDIDQTVTVVR